MKKKLEYNADSLINISEGKRSFILKRQKIHVVKYMDYYQTNDLFGSITERKKLLEKLGLLTKYNNIYLNFNFNYSKKRLKESIYKALKRDAKLETQKKMLTVFKDVISNAIPIETHKDKYAGTTREDITLDRIYVLLSAFRDDNYIYPVELIIKKFIDKNNTIYLAIAMEEIKKTQFQLPNGSIHWDTVSVSKLIRYVNDGEFLKYVPDLMLLSKQIEIKEKAIKKEQNKISKLKI